MNRQEVLENLCYYDKRNPTLFHLVEEQDSPKEERECYCDNCFYGRHELAEELLKHMGEDGTT